MNEYANNDEDDNRKESTATLSTITINLDALDSTKPLGEGELIFYDECVRLVDNIRKKAGRNIEKIKRKDSCDSDNVDEDSQSAPNCFCIDGARGSGKSTLLRAVRHILVNGKPTPENEAPDKLYPLADVDPTELGRGENFFIYLLGKIYELLNHKFKNNYHDEIELRWIRDAMQCLREMSSGLQILMNSEEVLKKDDTPEFFLENCLEKCADSSMMRNKLSSLIDILAKIVKADVFLITIDDADLNFSKCEEVLEYIRKYMHSPRLIFLFAGDMLLYSQIVRGMQLENFHEKQLVFDPKRKEKRNDLLDSIEEQYLMKLFPVDNRELITSLNKVVDIKHHILIQFANKNDKKEALDIKEALKKGLMIKTGSSFIDVILRLPLRSILFLLRHFVKNPYKFNSDEAKQYAWKGVQIVCQQSLLDYNVGYKEIIETSNIGMLQKTLLEYKAQTGQWHADLSIQPSEEEKREKQVALFLGGAVSLVTMPLSAKIKYWCACFPLWQRMQEEYLYTTNEREACNLLQSCLHHGNNRESNSYADLACTAMSPYMDETFLFSGGTICLLNEDCVQDNEKGQDARNGFKTLAKSFLKGERVNNHKVKRALSALSTCLCRVDDSLSSYYYLSIYHLLMEIANWLDFGNDVHIDLGQNPQTNTAAFREKTIKCKIKQKLSKQIIAASAQRIRSLQYRSAIRSGRHVSNSSNASTNRASAIERLAYTYSSQADASMVDEMYKWLIKYVSTSYITTQDDYCLAWEHFKAGCSEMSYKCLPVYQDFQECPKCAEILREYIKAMEGAMGFLPNDDGKTLEDCIKEFPLWKALKDSLKDNSIFAKELNKAHIGYYINAKNRQKSHELKSAYEYCLARIKKFEQTFATAKSKNIEAQQQLVEAEKLKKNREIKYKRVQKLIFDISGQQTKINSECKSLFNSEQQLGQKIETLRRKESRIIVSLSRVDHILIHIEKALNGASEDFSEYKFLIEDLQRHMRLKNQAKTERTEREHQDAINVIRREIKERQEEERKKASQKDQMSALIEKKKLQSELENVRTLISDTSSQMKITAKERQIKENDLTELKKKLDDSMTQEILAYIDQETARANCSNAKTIADKTQIFEDAAAKDLENERKLCKEAEEAYDSFKTFNPDV